MIFTLRNTYISLPVVRRCVETYPQVRPEKVQELERCRFAEIPEALTERAKAGKAYLEKHELEQLMRYKLTRGTFRPSLMSLINSNSEHSVQAVTEKAFFLCIGQTGSIEKVKQSITALTELKGVGPATASLILSVYDPVEVPFFADELFLYCTNQGLFTSQAPEKKYKIKYTMKEYQELLLQTQKTRSRIDTEAQGLGKASALDLEMTAYVLAHAPQLIKDEGGNQARSSGTMEIGESEEEASSATAADTGGKRDVADDQAEEVEDKPPAKRRRTSGRHKSDQPEPQKHEKSRRLRQRQMEH